MCTSTIFFNLTICFFVPLCLCCSFGLVIFIYLIKEPAGHSKNILNFYGLKNFIYIKKINHRELVLGSKDWPNDWSNDWIYCANEMRKSNTAKCKEKNIWVIGTTWLFYFNFNTDEKYVKSEEIVV